MTISNLFRIWCFEFRIWFCLRHEKPVVPNLGWFSQIHMPELARFYGIVIRMYRELGEPHHKPHFHAHYQQHSAVFTFDPLDMLEGSFPNAQRRLVEAWAELHKVELVNAWDSLKHGRKPDSIDPLK